MGYTIETFEQTAAELEKEKDFTPTLPGCSEAEINARTAQGLLIPYGSAYGNLFRAFY